MVLDPQGAVVWGYKSNIMGTRSLMQGLGWGVQN